MTQIKICGITREEEIAYLNEAGISYAGFVCCEKSKRYIELSDAKRICEKLNQNISKVAVMVSPTYEEIRRIADAGFDILQIHGAFDDALVQKIELPVWRAVNLDSISELKRWRMKNARYEAILLDAGSYGSGRTFGWDEEIGKAEWVSVIGKLKEELRKRETLLVLAGGLTTENVAEGIRIFNPDVVDVSSGVEENIAGQRKKRRDLIQSFAKAVRNENKKENER